MDNVPLLLVLLYLNENYFIVYYLCRLISYIIHTSNPQHLIVYFELFSYTFLFGELFYQAKEHIFCLLVDIGKVGCEFATCQQICIQDWAVMFDILQMPLALNPDLNLRLFG
jgi:hypothetical protein